MRNFWISHILLFSQFVLAGGTVPFGFMPLHRFNSGPVARLVATAYYADWTAPPTYASTGMAHGSFSIPTTGVQNGDLLLIIGVYDDGSDAAWPIPFATGFTQIYQKFIGNDGQTILVAWKIANNEPTAYAGSFVGGASSSTSMALIAVSGANGSTPIGPTDLAYATGTATNVATGTSAGVTTTSAKNLIIYANSGDWQGNQTTVTHNMPSGFTSLASLTDRGSGSVAEWASLQVGFKLQASMGATGPISGSQTGSNPGLGWAAVIAVQP
jgi:hypothetical protein